ncbi:MAG: DUF1343 domain-containing protein [Myxococcales bacterium]|nr:DUF1343 domain-containing protein [Myxococcales bacterium]
MVRTGAEVAASTGFALLRGRRVGVLANPSSLVRGGRQGCQRLHLVDALRAAGIAPARLFGPEHGLWATAQDLIAVDGGLDPVFSLDVATLYGRSEGSLHPTPAALEGLDGLVVDLQDVGARYYTYAATLCFALHAAAARGVELIVLDRPNPLGGEVVEGNHVEPGYRSFVGFFDLPQRHGLTLGEVAWLYAHEHGLKHALRVVPCDGWDPGAPMDEQDWGPAGSPWYAPSPNMPTVATAVVYPGLCLVEGTRLSEGRGTTRPFELVGAPWLDARAFADAIEAEGIPGLHARPMRFEPAFQKFAGTVCGGVALDVTDRARFPSVRAGLAVLRAARRLAPDHFAWRTETYEFVSDRLAIDLLMGGTRARLALEQDAPLDVVCADFADAELAFARRARPNLLYARAAGPLASSRAPMPLDATV